MRTKSCPASLFLSWYINDALSHCCVYQIHDLTILSIIWSDVFKISKNFSCITLSQVSDNRMSHEWMVAWSPFIQKRDLLSRILRRAWWRRWSLNNKIQKAWMVDIGSLEPLWLLLLFWDLKFIILLQIARHSLPCKWEITHYQSIQAINSFAFCMVYGGGLGNIWNLLCQEQSHCINVLVSTLQDET